MSFMRRIVISVFVVLIFPYLANGDSFNFSFTANQSMCASYLSSCTDFGSGTLTTDPLTFSYLYNNVYPITSIDGTFDGTFPIVTVARDDSYGPVHYAAIAGPGTSIYYRNGPLGFFVNGQVWALLREDQGPWQDFLYNPSTQTVEPINLMITTPEPSILVLLVGGIPLLITLFGRRRKT